MGFAVSVSNGYQFESKENLQAAARNILQSSGASSEQTAKIIEETFFNNNQNKYINPQHSVLLASTQITVNNSLKETLKYLKVHSHLKAKKQYVFGELWNLIATHNESSEDNPYRGELYDFKIDKKARNIFVA